MKRYTMIAPLSGLLVSVWVGACGLNSFGTGEFVDQADAAPCEPCPGGKGGAGGLQAAGNNSGGHSGSSGAGYSGGKAGSSGFAGNSGAAGVAGLSGGTAGFAGNGDSGNNDGGKSGSAGFAGGAGKGGDCCPDAGQAGDGGSAGDSSGGSDAGSAGEAGMDGGAGDSGSGGDSGASGSDAGSGGEAGADGGIPLNCNFTFIPLAEGSLSTLVVVGADLSTLVSAETGIAPLFKTHMSPVILDFPTDGTIKFPLVVIATAKDSVDLRAQDKLNNPRNAEYYQVNTTYFQSIGLASDPHSLGFLQTIEKFIRCQEKVVPIPATCPGSIPSTAFANLGKMSQYTATYTGDTRTFVQLTRVCK